jgi:cystathionine beta-lyase
MTKAHGGDAHKAELSPDTRVTIAGRAPFAHHGYVNTPVYHASTLLYRSAEEYVARRGPYEYARRGTPTSEALEKALQEIEGPHCAGVALLPSGLSAICTALQTVLRAGDHVLVTDSCYGPARRYCDSVLSQCGITTSYYDPTVGAGIAELIRPSTRAVYTEAPGSLSFEMQDIPAIVAAAHAGGALVLMDNTWASPLFFRPLDKGVDLAIQSASKYIGGHSDLVMGVVAASKAVWPKLRDMTFAMGLCVAPDDAYLALRGFRTLGVRLARHRESGIAVARWLEQRPEVLRVIHPALPSHPGHALWKRDFTGACGLFAIVLKPVPERAVHAFLDGLTLFGKGVSWGGYESLAIPLDLEARRTATEWRPGGPSLRLHIGLEDVHDLIADLERGFAALAAAR